MGRTVAGRTRRVVARRVRIQASAGNAVSRRAERSHRACQGIRWHRRSQVRERRARQAGRGTASARNKTEVIALKAGMKKTPEFALIDRYFKWPTKHTVLAGGDDG